MSKHIKVDNHQFNAEHYKGWKEDDFIKDQLPSVQDTYGSEANKIAFLKTAYAKINPSVNEEKPDKKATEKPVK